MIFTEPNEDCFDAQGRGTTELIGRFGDIPPRNWLADE